MLFEEGTDSGKFFWFNLLNDRREQNDVFRAQINDLLTADLLAWSERALKA